ncbi:peptide deformylase [Paenibacillus sp. ACRRX]|uniref:peptide deformylase n=1 Tax=unclassified Paenibacillus TaxID=185978 RepID=UPI001EF65C82|nr:MULTISPECIES: peptide deformylase [unclassified Paenibacillus]MCG7407603.1 peptide deformylase [Paenibacillus sp. ACRRX]MDK8180838.1 peptide deformylase [Paenibacillus sp. UMB4589-SE434]
MAIRIIVHEPDPVLHEVAKEVTKFNANLHKLLDDMADTMYDAEGVGLAAPQIGVLKRVIVVDVGDDNGLIEMVNPELIEMEGEQLGPEGCLSIPGLNGDVRRHQKIKVKGLDRNGEVFEMIAEDFLARAFQHEIDHLNGILFTSIADSVYEIQRQGKE